MMTEPAPLEAFPEEETWCALRNLAGIGGDNRALSQQLERTSLALGGGH